MKVKKHKFPGVYIVIDDDGSEKIATKNLVPGQRVYGERVVKFEGGMSTGFGTRRGLSSERPSSTASRTSR